MSPIDVRKRDKAAKAEDLKLTKLIAKEGKTRTRHITKVALRELDDCQNLADFVELCGSNRAWRESTGN